MDRSGQTVIAHTATYDDVDGGLQSPQWMPMPMTHDKNTIKIIFGYNSAAECMISVKFCLRKQFFS